MYHLNAEGSWEDQGTGYASIQDKTLFCHAEEVSSWDCEPGGNSRGLSYVLLQGTDLILEAAISQEDIYRQQGGATSGSFVVDSH